VARTQSSIAVTANDCDWMLFNASPDLRQQIVANRALHPSGIMRHSPIAAVFLTNGDVDHIAGLLSLRENQAFKLFGTAATLAQVGQRSVFGVLNPDVVERIPVDLGEEIDAGLGFTVRPFAVPGKVPLYLETDHVEVGAETETTVGVEIISGARRVVYVPGCAHLTPALLDRLDGADLLLFDGTTFTDDEMVTLGLSPKTAGRMGHLPISGAVGSLRGLASARVNRKVYIHINNTNPVLVAGSDARIEVEAAGWTVAHDGMEFAL
jgi:pyrroloquinoline quinone biosynthesis protein B